MRIILSRKGFDSTAGGRDSPVLDDAGARIVSLPIPGPPGPLYRELRFNGGTYADLMRRLGITSVGGVPTDRARAHADPDLEAFRAPSRPPGWRPMFGQADNAQAHLSNEGVGTGDFFLFFGRFRHVRGHPSGELTYIGEPFHLIWGYLEVGEVIDVRTSTTYPESMRDFVHVRYRDTATWGRRRNVVYVASPTSSLAPSLAGGGIFATYHAALRLTRSNGPLCSWHLPSAFHPSRTRAPLTYHRDPDRWRVEGVRVVVDSAKRGQEFVVDANSGIFAWVRTLLALA